MTGRLVALDGQLEQRPGLLGGAKLANVALAMAWGFVVIFVFVRLLPNASANVTISADLALSAAIAGRA